MLSRRLLPIMLAATAATAAACSGGGGATGSGASASPSRPPLPMIQVSSPAWHANGTLRPPTACAHSGDHGRSPALTWSAGPAATQYYAVTVTDRDAHGFLHWAALNLPRNTHSLAAGRHDSAKQLRNDFGYTGYGAPCPPPGTTHHYVLTVWALPAKADSMAEVRKQAIAAGRVTAQFRR